MSEYLFVFYAINEKFPDHPEGDDENAPVGLTNISSRVHYTPANIAETLKYPEPEPEPEPVTEE